MTNSTLSKISKLYQFAVGDPNKITLETYNRRVWEYIDNTPQTYQPHHDFMLNWIDNALSFLPKNSSVLEIGSATPRDAQYIRSKGHRVQCSDAALAFVEYLRKKGEDAQLINLLEDPIDSSYDMIFANSVVSHFTKVDFKFALKKIQKTLRPGKIFAFTIRQGEGSRWVVEKIHGKRFVSYWQIDELKSIIEECGMNILYLQDSLPGDLPSHEWIGIVAQKPSIET